MEVLSRYRPTSLSPHLIVPFNTRHYIIPPSLNCSIGRFRFSGLPFLFYGLIRYVKRRGLLLLLFNRLRRLGSGLFRSPFFQIFQRRSFYSRFGHNFCRRLLN